MLRAWSSLRFEASFTVSLDGAISVSNDGALPQRPDGSTYRWAAVSALINKGDPTGGKIQLRVDRDSGPAHVIEGANILITVGQRPTVVNLASLTHYHTLIHSTDTATLVFGFLDWQ